MSGLNYRHVSDVWVDAAQYLMDPPRGIGLPWWTRFTDMMGGLRPNELTLLCAPTGAGKTQLLANISAQLLIQGKAHFAAPVETGDSDFLIRLVSCLEKRDLNNGNPVHGDLLTQVTEKYRNLVFNRGLFLATYDNRVDAQEMLALLAYMHQEHGISVAILDNLNFFLKVTSSQMERAEMDNAIHEFVMLVKKIPIHVILVVHPKKTEHGRVESEFDIKGSSTAVQEAANVVLFNRPKREDVEKGIRQSTDRELVFRKIRKRGVNVGKPVWYQFESGRYEELRA